MPKNALDWMEDLYERDSWRAEILTELHNSIPVIVDGIRLTSEQFKRYVGWLRDGLRLAETMPKKFAIPPHIHFFPNPPHDVAGAGNNFFFYHHGRKREDDGIAISMLSAAQHACVESDFTLVVHTHPDINGLMYARSDMVLATLEECHHCNSMRVSEGAYEELRGSILSHGHPVEVDWRRDRDELIRAGVIAIRPTHQA